MRRVLIAAISLTMILMGCAQMQTNVSKSVTENVDSVASSPTTPPTPELKTEPEEALEPEIQIDDWKYAYANCLNNIMNNVEPICDSLEAFYYEDYKENGVLKDTPYYALMDLTEDGIPELMISAREPNDSWGEYSVYQAEGKSYSAPLTGMFARDNEDKKIYCGHDMSTEAYTVENGEIVFFESYVDCDGTWEHEETGKDTVTVPESEYNAFIEKADSARKGLKADFRPITVENMNKEFGELPNGSYEDCMIAYRKVIENEQFPYEQNRNWLKVWAPEYHEYVTSYAFANIDDDDYPELLVYCFNEEEPIWLLFSYGNGIVKKDENIFHWGSTPDSYMERQGVIVIRSANKTEMYGETFPYFNRLYYKLADGELEPLVSITSGFRFSYKEGDDGIPYKDEEITYTSLSVFTKTDSGIGYDEKDVKVVDEDISEASEEEQMSVQDKAFKDNGLDKQYGFIPSDGKPFKNYSYEEMLKKVQ